MMRASSVTAPFSPRVGDRVRGRYELMTPLRAEGPAQVFVAVDHQAGREVELTLFDPSLAQADPWAAFARMITAATAAKIPGLVLPRGVTRTAPTPPYCVTDLQMARGFDRQVEQGPTPWRRALTLCERVAEIVERAHAAAGAAHRALTSARCVITARGDVKVLDFGIAEFGPGQAADSPYRAPEQPAAADPRCDVYAIGVMLHELLAGQRVPAGPLPRWSAPDDATREVEALVARATAADPDQRHADPAALRAAMRALLDADDRSTAAQKAAAHAAAEAEAGAAEVRAPEAPETAAARRAAEAEAAAMDGPPLLPGGSDLSSGTSRPPAPLLPRAADMSEEPSPASPPMGRMNLSAGTSDSLSAASSSSLGSPASSGSRLAGSSSPSRSYPTLAGEPPSASSSGLRGSASPSRAHPTIPPVEASTSSSSLTSRPRAPGAAPSRSHPTLAPSLSEAASSSSSHHRRVPGSASPSRSHPTLSSAQAQASASSSSLGRARIPGSASASRSHPTLSAAQLDPAASSSSSNRARVPGSASPSRSHPTLSSAQARASASSRPRPPGAPPSRSYPTLAPPADRTEILAQSTIVAAERARISGAHPPVPAADRTEITPRRSVRGLPGQSRRDDAGSLHSSDLGDSTVIARPPTNQPTEELPVPAFARRGPGDPPTEQLPVPAFADVRGRHVDPPTDRIPVPAFADATQVLRADDLPVPASDPDATRIWRRPPDPSEIVEPARPAPESTMMLPTSGETVLFHHQEPVPRVRSMMTSIAGWSLRKKLLVVNLGLALVILFGVLAAVAC